VVGFTTGKSCLDGVFCLQQIISKQNENKEIHVVFVDSQRFMIWYQGNYCGIQSK